MQREVKQVECPWCTVRAGDVFASMARQATHSRTRETATKIALTSKIQIPFVYLAKLEPNLLEEENKTILNKFFRVMKKKFLEKS